MNLIAEFTTSGYDDWKAAFDGEGEERDAAGLTLMQMWRAVDEPATVTCLFEAHDRGRAQAWLDRVTGFGAAVTARFVTPTL